MKMKMHMKTAVVGGGMIGLSQCVLLSCNRVPVTLYVHRDPEKKKKQYLNILRELMWAGVLTSQKMEWCASYLEITTRYEDLAGARVVFECALEDLKIKEEIYKALHKSCPDLQAVVSSTSAISSEELAEHSPMPEKVFVAHPFYPPHLVRCVEVVTSSRTSPEALRIVMDLLKWLGREVVILKKDAPGFIVNRIQYAMLREAVHIVEQGIADPEDVDRALRFSIMPRYTQIGLFEHFDNCGLDLARTISSYLFPSLAADQGPGSYVNEHCRLGQTGVKSGQGTYRWDKKAVEELKERTQKPYIRQIDWHLPEGPA
jgi:3-hydroxybutyryl-CoA dehydrogenase